MEWTFLAWHSGRFRVADGNGGLPRTADVEIVGGIITEIGQRLARGRREVDADGALVTPGFVDIHTHYDGQASWGRRAAAVCLARRDDGRDGQLRDGFALRRPGTGSGSSTSWRGSRTPPALPCTPG